MSEVHRYQVVTMLSAAGATIGYDPHGPDVVMAADFDRVTAERDALQLSLTAADERADVLTTALTRIHGRAEAFIDDGMHMPTPSIEVIRDIAARAVPITSDAAEPR